MNQKQHDIVEELTAANSDSVVRHYDKKWGVVVELVYRGHVEELVWVDSNGKIHSDSYIGETQ